MPLPESGFILHSRPYRETSLIVELFTQTGGRITVVVKGLKKNKAWRGLAQPFRKLQINFSGRHDLKTLTQMEALGQSYPLAGLPLYSGYYINELIVKMLPLGAACENLFAFYEFTMNHLAAIKGQDNQELEPCLREFEFELFNEMGIALDFSSESGNGDPVYPEINYWISVDHGISRTVLADAISVKGETLIAIAAREWQATSLAGAKVINRYFIDRLLPAKTLHSRKMIRDYISLVKDKEIGE